MSASEVSLTPHFAALGQFYQQAAHKTGCVERFYTIAGHILCLRFAGHALVPAVTSALAHLATAAPQVPDLTICLADSESSGICVPAPPLPAGSYRSAEAGLYYCHYGQGTWQEALATHLRMGFLVIGAAANYPAYAHAAPMRNLLIWWLAQHGLYGLHSAAVGAHGGAALIVGKSGAGKSTTAITCLQAGLAYLGDDLCLLQADVTLWVYSLYSSGKLCADSRRWLAPCAAAVSRLGDDDKMVYQWHPHVKSQLPAALPIRALFLLGVHDAGQTAVRPATPGEAFTTLSTTTLRVTSLPPATAQGLLGAIKQLVQQTPCYHLALGRDMAQIPATILSVLQQ